jgi:hypothetical protein
LPTTFIVFAWISSQTSSGLGKTVCRFYWERKILKHYILE